MKIVFSSVTMSLVMAASLLSGAAWARFEKVADLSNVSVSTDANFQVGAGRDILRTWIRLDFKEQQRFDLAPHPMQAKTLLAYRSRKDYVQVDCRRNLYGELATQMFSETEGKGETVFESTYLRSAMPRFATPATHEGVILVFLCKGIKPEP